MLRTTTLRKRTRAAARFAFAGSMIVSMAASLSLASPISAQAPPETQDEAATTSLRQALVGGTWALALRYRFESVDDEAFSKDANASTLRTTLEYASAPWHQTRVVLQFENVAALPDDDGYRNAGSGSLSNGVFDRPVVADPEQTDLLQIYLDRQAERWRGRLGRQAVNVGDQRFVGAVGWRQHHQTFDALRFEADFATSAAIDYAYLGRVHRIFGDDREMQGHSLRVPFALPADGDDPDAGSWLTVVPYGLWLDFEEAPTLSTSTLGVELSGKGRSSAVGWQWQLEHAVQQDQADNPRDIDTSYSFAEVALKRSGLGLRLAWERLAGGQGGAFQTPLATLHKWNGWADKFLVTPPAGLDTIYATLSGAQGELKWSITWLDFTAESGPSDYGDELDAQLLWKHSSGVGLGLKLAHYRADQWSTDTDKIMAWATYAFRGALHGRKGS